MQIVVYAAKTVAVCCRSSSLATRAHMMYDIIISVFSFEFLTWQTGGQPALSAVQQFEPSWHMLQSGKPIRLLHSFMLGGL